MEAELRRSGRTLARLRGTSGPQPAWCSPPRISVWRTVHLSWIHRVGVDLLVVLPRKVPAEQPGWGSDTTKSGSQEGTFSNASSRSLDNVAVMFDDDNLELTPA